MFRLTLLLAASVLLVAQTPEYGGPSILSRGGPASTGNNSAVSFRPFIGISAIYDTGLTGLITDSSGHFQNRASEGIQGSAGIYGHHNFRHSVIGLDYRLDAQHFARDHYADGINQMLTLGFTHQLNRRLTFSLSEIGGMYGRNYFFTSASGVIDPIALNLPANDLFDNKVIYGQTGARLIYRLSARLSIAINAAGYLVRRRSTSLYGVTGYTTGWDVGYRLTRFLTFGVDYNFNHFDFTKAFGASDIHSGEGFLSTRLSRTIELAVALGAARVETLFFGVVAIDPAIAAITGQTAGIRAFYNVQYVPSGRLRLIKQWPRTSLQVSAEQGINPGNGVYLTSRSSNAGVNFSYSGLRHWNLGVNASYSRLGAVAQTVGTYTGYTAGFGVNRDLARSIHVNFRVDDHRYATNVAGFKRNAIQASLGFYWSPGDIPLSLW